VPAPAFAVPVFAAAVFVAAIFASSGFAAAALPEVAFLAAGGAPDFLAVLAPAFAGVAAAFFAAGFFAAGFAGAFTFPAAVLLAAPDPLTGFSLVALANASSLVSFREYGRAGSPPLGKAPPCRLNSRRRTASSVLQLYLW
jgi:hypothetical protein